MIPILHDVLDLLYPRICNGCGNTLVTGEDFICSVCMYELPKTLYWKDSENKVAKIFWGRVYIENAVSFLIFQKGGRVQKIMHHLKYDGKKELGQFVGQLFGNELISTPFENVDILVPVPIHHSRLKKRGYNQSEWIAKGIGEKLNKPLETSSLVRNVKKGSQVNKGRFDRWENVQKVFSVIKPEKLENKHVLLVDDVLTTGATIESCAQQILTVPNTKVSVATLAVAS